jgi:hypothetical protein
MNFNKHFFNKDFHRKKITFLVVDNVTYIITQKASIGKMFFSHSAFSRFLKGFWPKNFHNSVIVRDNLIIPTAMSS